MATSVEDVCNQALRRIGNDVPIGYIFEGSRASRVALDLYGQTRDQLLREQTWNFARRDVVLTLLKTAPVGGYGYGVVWTTAYPPPPWIYEYAYPADCIRVRSLRNTPILIPTSAFDPTPTLFVDTNDQSLAPPARVVLTNQKDAIAIITGRITDMAQWPVDFTESVVEALGRRFAEAYSMDQNAIRTDAALEQATATTASKRDG